MVSCPPKRLYLFSFYPQCMRIPFSQVFFLSKEGPGLWASEEEAKRRDPAKTEWRPREMKTCSHKHLYIVVLFIAARKWKQPKCLMEYTFNKTLCTHTHTHDLEYNLLMWTLVLSELNENYRFWFTFFLCEKVCHEVTLDPFTHFNEILHAFWFFHLDGKFLKKLFPKNVLGKDAIQKSRNSSDQQIGNALQPNAKQKKKLLNKVALNFYK